MFTQLKSTFIFMVLLVLFAAVPVYASNPADADSAERVGEQAQIHKQHPITTTHSQEQAAPLMQEELFGQGLSNTRLVQSTAQINLDNFRADARFAGIDGSGYAVVILDTGMDLDHPFFGPDSDGDGVADRVVYHEDFADNDLDASDVAGHGTHVTSIALSSDPVNTGMAPGADIIHLKVFANAGGLVWADVEDALQWVLSNIDTYNIVSVNMSFGDGNVYATNQALYGLSDEFAALKSSGVVVVNGSGNGFFTWGSALGVDYPSADASVYSVGAVYDANVGGVLYGSGAQAFTTGIDRLAPFTHRSPTLSDVFAPGAPILAADLAGSTSVRSGSSMAAPHLAGIVPLIQQLAVQEFGHQLAPDDLMSLVQDSAFTIFDGDDENDNVINSNLNYGRLDVLALGNELLASNFCEGELATIVGTSNNDVIFGSNGKDVIHALGGNDTIFASGGNDIVCAGTGDDVVYGSTGNDLIRGGSGDDELHGEDGSDTIYGLWDEDEIHGGGDTDYLYGGDDDDLIYGDAGNDFIYGEDGADELRGKNGDDTIDGGDGEDEIYGGNGVDYLRGQADADTIHGGNDADILLGNKGADTIFGDDGNDIIDGGRQSDTCTGGAGFDIFTSCP